LHPLGPIQISQWNNPFLLAQQDIGHLYAFKTDLDVVPHRGTPRWMT
jgi:hypothetical protein